VKATLDACVVQFVCRDCVLPGGQNYDWEKLLIKFVPRTNTFRFCFFVGLCKRVMFLKYLPYQ